MGSVEVRDPVHGLISFSPREWSVVDTAAFRRLRGVQQLALTHHEARPLIAQKARTALAAVRAFCRA